VPQPPPSSARSVLARTADPRLADDLQRLAAAAGVPLTVRPDLPDAREIEGCPLLVVGGDLAAGTARQLARRASPRPERVPVLLVTNDLDDADVWQHAVALGAEQVVVLPDGQDWLVDRLAATVEPTGAARVVAVVGGCGGAGASVLAAALAVTAADTGHQVLLADLDPLGPGADLTLGVVDVPGLRWPDLAAARGRLPGGSVREALPRLDDLAVLTFGRGEPVDLAPRVVDAVLAAAVRTHDLVVLDLPRSGDPAAVAALAHASELLVVVPARLRATAAAAALLTGWGQLAPVTRAVVRRSSRDPLAAHTVADALGLRLALQMRDDPGLDQALRRSQAPGLRARSPLRLAAEQWLAQREVPGRAA